MSIVVSDTSPIRALTHLGRLDLLHELYDEVLVPPAVASELQHPRATLAALDIQHLSFIRIQAPADRALVNSLAVELDAGESEAIALAIEVRADGILMDEKAGRRAARQRGLIVTGVLGVLVAGKREGCIDAVAPLLDKLQRELGFFISPSLRAETLRQAGE